MNTNSKELIYFDNATTSFKLHSFIERLLQSYSNTSWIENKNQFLQSLIQKISNWLQVTPEQIDLVPSSTYAINEIFEVLIKNWKHNSMTVYISEQEHISNLASLWNFSERYKNFISIQYYKSDKQLIKELVNEKGVILVTFRDNLGNCIWKKEEILELMHKNKELIIIGDFTQSIFSDQISKLKEYFDCFYFSAHKILGPFGLGCIVHQKNTLNLKTFSNNCPLTLDWRSIYVWEKEFENILSVLEKSEKQISNLINYWISNFPVASGFSYEHFPNSLIFLVKTYSGSTHDFAYLLEEQGFIFRFNDLCSTNSLLSDGTLIRFSLSPLNTISEIEKLFRLMKYFGKIMWNLK